MILSKYVWRLKGWRWERGWGNPREIGFL